MQNYQATKQRQEARKRFFAVNEELRKSFSHLSTKEIQQLIDKAIEKVRRFKKAA